MNWEEEFDKEFYEGVYRLAESDNEFYEQSEDVKKFIRKLRTQMLSATIKQLVSQGYELSQVVAVWNDVVEGKA